MSSPDKDLPKMDNILKNELESPHALKHSTTDVKNVLPSKQDILKEKVEDELKASIKQFDANALKHTETLEKNVLPTKEEIEAEKNA